MSAAPEPGIAPPHRARRGRGRRRGGTALVAPGPPDAARPPGRRDRQTSARVADFAGDRHPERQPRVESRRHRRVRGVRRLALVHDELPHRSGPRATAAGPVPQTPAVGTTQPHPIRRRRGGGPASPARAVDRAHRHRPAGRFQTRRGEVRTQRPLHRAGSPACGPHCSPGSPCPTSNRPRSHRSPQ